MRICYLILTHRGEAQIQRLVETIKRSDPDSFVLISHDFSVSSIDKSKFERMEDVKVIAGKGSRSSFRLCQKYLEAVDWLFQNEVNFDWLISLSGQDYPIQPLARVKSFLESTNYDGFMEYFKAFSPESPWGLREARNRYCFRHWQISEQISGRMQKFLRPLQAVNFIQPLFRLNFSYGVTFGIKSKPPFSDSITCYGGSFFFTLSRKCIQYIYDEWKSESALVRYFRRVNLSSESFFQTLLLNSKKFEISNDCHVYFDFAKSANGHPRLLTSQDYSVLSHNSAHFARKFDLSLEENIFSLLDEIIFENAQL